MCQSNKILFVIRLVLRVQLKYDQKQLCKHKHNKKNLESNNKIIVIQKQKMTILVDWEILYN